MPGHADDAPRHHDPVQQGSASRQEEPETDKGHARRAGSQPPPATLRTASERAKWELQQKDKKANGNLIMTCPASGSNRHLDCPLKPNEPALKPDVDLMTVENTPKMPGDICTNKNSVTFEAEHGAKCRRHHRYGAAEWDDMHTYGRQTIESYNMSPKRSDNSLHDSTNRRLRGETNQAFLTALGVVAHNGRNIFKWLDEGYDETRPAKAPQRRQKRTNHHAPVVRTGSRAKKKPSRDLSASRRARCGLIPA